MAYRASKSGYAAEAQRKIASKYDPEQERKVLEWIEAVLGESLSGKNTHEKLKDGSALCKLINVLQPGSIKRINSGGLAFKQMENTANFLKAIGDYGVPVHDQFQTVDLFEAQNMVQVFTTLEALGRQAQRKGFDGPTIGVKLATENKREFSDEQMKAGQNVIGLQMGTNKGATAQGVNFGNTRHM